MKDTNTDTQDFPVKGVNYCTHRENTTGPDRSADVLRVANGLVLYRVVLDGIATDELRVASIAGFRRGYRADDAVQLIGPNVSKAKALKALPEQAAQLW